MKYTVLVTRSGIVNGRVNCYSEIQAQMSAVRLAETLGGRIIQRHQTETRVWEVDTTKGI